MLWEAERLHNVLSLYTAWIPELFLGGVKPQGKGSLLHQSACHLSSLQGVSPPLNRTAGTVILARLATAARAASFADLIRE